MRRMMRRCHYLVEQSAGFATRKILWKSWRAHVLSAEVSSTHTEHVFITGATRRGILLVRFAISNTSLVTLFCPELWLRRQLLILDTDGDYEDSTAFLLLFLLRAVGFLLPCYIVFWAISILLQAKRGSCSIGSNTICSRVTLWTAERCTVYHSTSYTSGACFIGSRLNDKRIVLDLLT